jgi:hypothetical protein
VGITKTTTALTRWALSYNLRVHIASQTRELYNVHLSLDDEIKNNESTASRMTKDCDQQGALKDTLKRYGVFDLDACSAEQCLQNVATKDIATSAIESSLIEARELGQKQL